MFEIGKKNTSRNAPEKHRPEASRRESPAATPAARPSTTPQAPVRTAAPGPRNAAVIGPSIHINGDVRGEEDLIIEGEVHGTVKLANNSLTIGREGKVKADAHAHSIYVDGHVEGDLYGSERVSVRSSAQVRGNITSPRVSLEEGARFRGSIDMDPEAVQSVLGKPSGAAKAQAAASRSPSAGAPPKSNGNQRPGPAASRPAETAVKSESPR